MKSAALLLAVMHLLAAGPSKPAAKKTKPVVTEAARRAFVKGNAVMQDAKKPEDYVQATRYYEEASSAAPGWAEPLFNLAKARELRGDFAGAITALQGYIKAGGADSRQAQDLIYGLETKRDRAAEAAKQPDFKGSWKQTVANDMLGRLNSSMDISGGVDGGWKIAHGYNVGDAPDFSHKLDNTVSDIRVEDRRMRFKVTWQHMPGVMHYDLTLSDDGSKLAGTWYFEQYDKSRGLGFWAQAGTVSLTFTR